MSADSGVRLVLENLSTSFPEVTPQKSVSFMILAGGMLTTNSLASLMSLWEYRDGRIPNPTVGGSEHTVPAHAKVIMLGVPFASTHVTRTTGHGNRAV